MLKKNTINKILFLFLLFCLCDNLYSQTKIDTNDIKEKLSNKGKSWKLTHTDKINFEGENIYLKFYYDKDGFFSTNLTQDGIDSIKFVSIKILNGVKKILKIGIKEYQLIFLFEKAPKEILLRSKSIKEMVFTYDYYFTEYER